MSLKKQFLKSKPVAKVTFNLPKEATNGKSKVVVLGEFNNWDPSAAIPMKAVKGGYSAVLELETGRNYQFRYLINNVKWENDWAADDYVPSPFGVDNSVVELPTVINKKTTKKKAAIKKPAAKTAKKVVKGNDLKKIEGIGPKIAGLLKDSGIVTFEDLSKAKQSTLKGVLASAGKRYQMHEPKSWPKQAKLAAKGDWDKLEKLQNELKGGK